MSNSRSLLEFDNWDFFFTDFCFLGQNITRRRNSTIVHQIFGEKVAKSDDGLEFDLKGKAWIRIA